MQAVEQNRAMLEELGMPKKLARIVDIKECEEVNVFFLSAGLVSLFIIRCRIQFQCNRNYYCYLFQFCVELISTLPTSTQQFMDGCASVIIDDRRLLAYVKL